MEPVRDICSGCGKLKMIQSKFHWMCSDCMFEKTHAGKTKEEVYKERHENKEHKKVFVKKEVEPKADIVQKLKRQFSIKQVSNKRAIVEAELKKVYKRIDQTREPVCEGCGRGSVVLSHSHILSKYFRPDLICEEDNIRLHCMGETDSCHTKWESGPIEEVMAMDDFKENLAYIESVDRKAYNKILIRIEELKNKKI